MLVRLIDSRSEDEQGVNIVKVRPYGQQFGHTTLYNKVVRHKMCRGHAKSCFATNVHIFTIFFYKYGATAT